ncbi:hypothetical protein BH10BAC5_BH10BAC5_01060 [soil metagenome]
MKIFFYSVLVVLSISSLVFSQSSKIDPFLAGKMASASANEKLPVYIVFDKHLGLADFNDIGYEVSKQDRRKIVIDRLQRYSANSQAGVQSFLNSKVASGNADKFEVLWMANALIIKADKSVITQLAEQTNNVIMIAYDSPYPIEMMYDDPAPTIPFLNSEIYYSKDGKSPNSIEPGITLMKADQCWSLGNRGEGVLVANADDGFWWKHPDLVHGVWQNLGEDANHNGMTVIFGSGTTSTYDAGDLNGIDDDGNGKIDDLIGWDFDINSGTITTSQHGSATLGHVIGDGTGGTNTGVAPLAKCILMRNNGGGQSNQWLAFQYGVLMGADVITSSLSFKWYFNPKPDYSMMRTITDMSLAAGVVHTNSTSNDGNNLGQAPVPINISSAGNNPPPWLHPDQLKRGGISGVIGVGDITCTNDLITSSSPYGPATWGNWSSFGPYTYAIDPNHKDYPYSVTAPVEVPDSMGLIKPDVTAPGSSSISTYVSSGTGYGTFGGTSSATPHTAGCIALMLSLNPDLLPADIDKILELTSVEKGPPGKDNRYGTGRIDALAATTSPRFTVAGINGPSNMLISNQLAPLDTAKELVGIKISTTLNPQLGSLKKIKFGMTTTALAVDVTSFDLYWDKDKNGIVNAGDQKLKSIPYVNGPLTFDSLKFKFLDTARNLLLVARTTALASSSKLVNLGLTDTNQVVAYYTTTAMATNFPIGVVTGIPINTGNPFSYALSQNYPNPFNPTTIINYQVAGNSFVTIKIFDMLGKEVATLINGMKTAGNYQVEFDTKDHNIASGIYYYKMEVKDQNFTDIKKMILIK